MFRDNSLPIIFTDVSIDLQDLERAHVLNIWSSLSLTYVLIIGKL